MRFHHSTIPLLIQRAGYAVWLCAFLVCQGCASGAMLARDLPRDWHAVAASNAQTVDLSKLASATIPQDLIAQGDVIAVDLRVGLKKDDNPNFTTRVQENGEIDLPFIGSIPIVGMSMQDAEQAIRTSAIRRDVYRDPKVTVSMVRPRVNRITVIGAVNKPGTIELRPGNSDLLQAITAAGNLAEEAGTIVEVRHPGFQPGTAPQGGSPAIAAGGADGVISASGEMAPVALTGAKTLKVDLASIGSEGVGIPTLTDGTVIWVDKQDPLPLTVVGLVATPGQFEFPVGQDLSVLDAISLSRGINNPVANKIYVIRKRPGVAEPLLIEVSYSRAKRNGRENILLQPGDVVSVEQTPATVIVDVVKTASFGISGRAF